MGLKKFLLATTTVAGLAAFGAISGTTSANAAVALCPSTPFTGTNSNNCNLTITFNANGSITTTQQPGATNNFDGTEDALIGVINNTLHPITSFSISGSGIFGFDSDGIDTFISGAPAGANTDGSGYGGPNGFFTIIDANTGFVNFANGAIAAGGTDFFSLEESININAPPIIGGAPEPGTLMILGGGLAGLGWLRRRRKKV